MDNQKIDGYLFTCKLCGEPHEVPEQFAPYQDGGTLRLVVGDPVSLPCAAKEGTAQYFYRDFKPFSLTKK